MLDAALKEDFAIAMGLVLAATSLAATTSRIFLKDASFAARCDAADKVLCPPLFTLVGSMACVASWQLHGTVELRWSGETFVSRWCGLIYCAKMALDVPVQSYTLSGARRLQMVGHHFLSLVAIGTGLVVTRCGFFASLAVCSELSTPFLSTVMAIKEFGSDTPAQKLVIQIAGVGLWLAYIPFRLVNFPLWLYVFFADQSAAPEATVAITSAFERCYFPAVIFFLLVLSVVWFDKITRGLARALRGDKKES